jgi:membrane dipeptidase
MIADLHCDLLWYLSLDPKRTPYDLEARCAVPQLKEGRVKLQVLPIFVETNGDSVASGEKQAQAFKSLPASYPDVFKFLRFKSDLDELSQQDNIGILPAIENASAICSETEDLSIGLERLTALQRKVGKLLYVSLTWNTENRFGGGAHSKVGLKEDGKELVDYLCSKGIAVDFSHTSDYLAYDLLNYIDKKGLSLPLMASHSNMRAVCNVPRNLPDDIAKEIIKRQGVIGINFIRYFLGAESPVSFAKQLEHVLQLGGEQAVCLGADFFCIEDLPLEMQKPLDVLFFPSFNHAGSYSRLIELWKKELGLDLRIMAKISSENLLSFIKKLMF